MKKTQPKQETDQMTAPVEDFESKWKRALADYQNLEKRVSQQQQLFVRLANVSLVEKLLPIFDDLKRAHAHIKDVGLEMIINQLEKVLEEENIVIIQALGKQFDASLMECIETVDGEKDTVMRVALDGYLLGDTVIRPAKVAVGNGQKL